MQTTSDQLHNISGSANLGFSNKLLNAIVQAAWRPQHEALEDQKRHTLHAFAAMRAFRPRDEVEAMLAAQATALHLGAMEALRRSMIPDQPFEAAARYRKDGANLARAMAEMVEALDRKRGARPQVVRVERVVVQDGGQAIVGNLSAGALNGGDGHATEPAEEPQTPRARLAHEPATGPIGATLRSPDEERECVPWSGDGERQMPAARRRKYRPENS